MIKYTLPEHVRIEREIEKLKHQAELSKMEMELTRDETALLARKFSLPERIIRDFSEKALKFLNALDEPGMSSSVDTLPFQLLPKDVAIMAICGNAGKDVQHALELPPISVFNLKDKELNGVQKVSLAAGLNSDYIQTLYREYLKDHLRT